MHRVKQLSAYQSSGAEMTPWLSRMHKQSPTGLFKGTARFPQKFFFHLNPRYEVSLSLYRNEEMLILPTTGLLHDGKPHSMHTLIRSCAFYANAGLQAQPQIRTQACIQGYLCPTTSHSQANRLSMWCGLRYVQADRCQRFRYYPNHLSYSLVIK